jgi:hypothetical protein
MACGQIAPITSTINQCLPLVRFPDSATMRAPCPIDLR